VNDKRTRAASLPLDTLLLSLRQTKEAEMSDPKHPKQDNDDPWLEEFSRKMDEPSAEEEAFFARRRALGLGVGLDENGKLVYAEDLLKDQEPPQSE
jgi:uncharacterized membrane protein YdbT with pleckstrin-like domain